MRNFFEENYESFLIKIKKYICSMVKMGKYSNFFEHLNIQLLVQPTKMIKSNVEDKDALVEKFPKPYWVTLEKVEQTYYVIKNLDIQEEGVRVSGDHNIFGTYEYELIWFVEDAKKYGFVEKYIVMTLLDILRDIFILSHSLDVFKEDSFEYFFNKVDFMANYYEKIKKQFDLPPIDLISKVAYKTYENRENRGIMCIVSADYCDNLNEIIKFSDASIDEAGFIESNVDNMRKLLEISKPSYEGDKDKCLLFNPANKRCWGLILDEKIDEKIDEKSDYLRIYFWGAGKWEIKHNRKTVFKSNYDTYCFDNVSQEDLLKDKLPKQIINQQIFLKLIGYLEKQRHGALVIIAPDAEEETDRLCNQFKRGTKIEPLNLDESDDAFNIISGFCSVDGAIFVDLCGYCFGYGIILDGAAKIKGERGRGARYNSALNYVADSNKYAIVVSEDKDKDIEILPH